ncbi:conserved hypothetical protein [Crenothrix polyspora]|uniref:DUF6883 domain-containing protein n=2 Tax=Crenothrix polyspora TaxID=360316 RepID=A0A1R4H3K1_9GAMM|nr:conserved hypothetical protein [Crenothrix polyspora]
MKLPNADKAVIPPEKLRDYLLSSSHPVGKFKAEYFRTLGYTRDNWTRLDMDLRITLDNDARTKEQTQYGQKFEVSGHITTPSGRTVMLVTAWILLRDETFHGLLPPIQEIKMDIKLFDTVVLKTDVPKAALRAGDMGAVVELYEPGGLEVEFVTGSGETQALVTLTVADVRLISPSDMLAVRSLSAA